MPTEIAPTLALELISGPTLPPISRPLSMQGAHTYAALWPFVRHANTKHAIKRQLVFVRDDGVLHLPADSQPIAPARLPSSLPHALPVPEDRLWSATGVQRYLAGQRPHPAAVFHRLTRVLAHFVDFTGSLAEPSVMAELFAAYILSTWLAPAFPVLPLLWITGDRGAGKSRLLGLLAQFCHLGVLLPALPPFEPLCALAGLGAALALDDAHAFTTQETGAATWPRRGPHAVLIAGRQRGPLLPLAGLGPHDPPRQLAVYGPRLFASTRPPHSALAGYCLVVPLLRTVDTALLARDPLDPASWAAANLETPRALIDDLWALSLSRLADLPPHLALVLNQATAPSDTCPQPPMRVPPATSSASHLSHLPPAPHGGPISHLSLPIGSALQPWHAILAVASWLSSQPVQPASPHDPPASPSHIAPPTTTAGPHPPTKVSPPTSHPQLPAPLISLPARLAPLTRGAHSLYRAPASTDSAALALQGIQVFALFALYQLAEAYDRASDRAIAAGGEAGAGSNDGSDTHDDTNVQEIGQNDGDDTNDTRIDLVDHDDSQVSPLGPGPWPSGPSGQPAQAGDHTVPARPRLPLADLWPAAYTFTVGALLECMRDLAADQGSDLPPFSLTDDQVGRLLSHLGLHSTRTAQRRQWSITAAQLVHLSRAYNLPISPTLAQALNHVIQKQAAKK